MHNEELFPFIVLFLQSLLLLTEFRFLLLFVFQQRHLLLLQLRHQFVHFPCSHRNRCNSARGNAHEVNGIDKRSS